MFVIMGLAPLLLAIRAGWRSTLIGTINVRGEAFDRTRERSGMWLPQARTDENVMATASDWAGALLITALGAGLGYYAAQLVWFG